MLINLKQFWQDEDGATAIEYGLIAGLIAVVLIGALTALGEDLGGLFERISDELKKVAPGTTPDPNA